MKKNLEQSVDGIDEFLDMKLEPEAKKRVYEHCTFDCNSIFQNSNKFFVLAMKKNPMANRDSNYLFNTNIGKFMRKGEIGDWKNYFTLAQNQLFDETYEQKMADTDLTFGFEQ